MAAEQSRPIRTRLVEGDGYDCHIWPLDGYAQPEVDQLATLLQDQVDGMGTVALPHDVWLVTPPLTYAKRQQERQGTWTYALSSGEAALSLLRYAPQVMAMQSLETQDESTVFDTSKFALAEIAATIAGIDLTTQAPAWEVALLERQLDTFRTFYSLQNMAAYPTDAAFLTHAIATIERSLVSLPLISDAQAVAGVREEIRTAMGSAWMAAFSNKLPCFYTTDNGDPSLDTVSQKWKSGFFKPAKAEPALRMLLNQAHVLDPYGGTGEAVHLLRLRGLARSALSFDISYPGGQPIVEDRFYAPALNARVMELCFDGLPSWYQPRLDERVTYQVADSRLLPVETDSVDYVVTDPPYGVECPQGGQELLMHSMPEMLRAARYGAIMLVPTAWDEALNTAGFRAQPLTHELSNGRAAIPTQYLHVTKL